MVGRLAAYHQGLFEWHCRTFFRFDRHLSRDELGYLALCFELADAFEERPAGGQENLSYYTYSHRVAGADVNSSRIAYGSMAHAARAAQAAAPVLAAREVAVDGFFFGSPHSTFYGLGWDVLAGHFKVYFHVAPLEALPQERLRALGRVDGGGLRPEGLVSFTYQGGALVEEKVYVYPESPQSLPPGSHHLALMRTSHRGEVAQYDVDDAGAWLDRLNEAGRHIVQAYRGIGEPLDTIAYVDRDHFTLYFP